MGIGPFSGSRYDGCDGCAPVPAPRRKRRSTAVVNQNPDPANWEILESKRVSGAVGAVTILKVRYPDCTNYEGEKVMVFAGKFDFRGLDRLDPHFSADGELSPIARFPPTEFGWRCALAFARSLTSTEIA